MFWNPVRPGWFNRLNRSGRKMGRFKPGQLARLGRKRVKLNRVNPPGLKRPRSTRFSMCINSFILKYMFSTFPFLVSTFHFSVFPSGTLWRLTGEIDLDEAWFTSLYRFQRVLSGSFSDGFYWLAEPVATPVPGWTRWSRPVFKTICTINLLGCMKLCVFY